MPTEKKAPGAPVTVLAWIFVALIGRRLLMGGAGQQDFLAMLDVVMLIVALVLAVSGTARWLRERDDRPPRGQG